MTGPDHLQFRLASPSDAQAVAALHANSWRRHYRGAYTDSYLDGDVATDRLALWSNRLAAPDPLSHTLLAEDDDGLVGFAHTIFEDDPAWGALLDNLHVVADRKRKGIGSRLLTLTAQAVVRRGTKTGFHVWVLEQNTDAAAFYQARGGQYVDRREVSPPEGLPGRLNGAPIALRYAWPDPFVLVANL
ncbi:MAG: GNAT family N-acetyltransferase [Streptosporangiales bacterium]